MATHGPCVQAAQEQSAPAEGQLWPHEQRMHSSQHIPVHFVSRQGLCFCDCRAKQRRRSATCCLHQTMCPEQKTHTTLRRQVLQIMHGPRRRAHLPRTARSQWRNMNRMHNPEQHINYQPCTCARTKTFPLVPHARPRLSTHQPRQAPALRRSAPCSHAPVASGSDRLYKRAGLNRHSGPSALLCASSLAVLPARAGRALRKPRARPTDLGLAAVGRQQLGCGARLAAGRRRRDELAQLGARVLQLAQLHLYPHRHPLEAPERLRAGAAASVQPPQPPGSMPYAPQPAQRPSVCASARSAPGEQRHGTRALWRPVCHVCESLSQHAPATTAGSLAAAVRDNARRARHWRAAARASSSVKTSTVSKLCRRCGDSLYVQDRRSSRLDAMR